MKKCKESNNFTMANNNSNIKVIPNDKNNTIIINNNINTYNYSLNFNKNDNLKKKRNRKNSFEGFFNLLPEKEFSNNNKKFCMDENELIKNFNSSFKNLANEFEDVELQNLIMLSQNSNSNLEEILLYGDNHFKDKENFFDDILLCLNSKNVKFLN